MRSVLQDWVMELGLRHQGVLVSAVRGCDDEPRNSCTKMLIRCLRETMLVCHCGESSKAATFIELVGDHELQLRMDEVRRNLDHLPHHFVMHLLHAAEIVGYKHPEPAVASIWRRYYERLVLCLHLRPESEADLDARLSADEDSFARAAMETNGLPVASEVRITGGDVVCQRCDGCGKIADSEHGEPWTAWARLPPGANAAVLAGIVNPIRCPACDGIGRRTLEAAASR